MKNIFYLGLFWLGSQFASNKINAQPVLETGAKIEFAKETHDYGNVKYGANGVCTFKFKNTGNTPLIISKATGSCGCTVPSWPKEPIAPGESAEISVKYNTTKPGPISRNVTIASNAVNEPNKILYVKGSVAPAPENATPINNSGPANH